MKSFEKYFLLFTLLLLAAYGNAQEVDRHCLADQFLSQQKENNPQLIFELEDLEQQIQQQIQQQKFAAQPRSFTATIPVVVHIVWVETEQNISEEIILSQIQVLNEDFQKRNENRVNVPDDFAPLMANIGFEFCLATVDPDGQATTGITRTSTTIDCIGNIEEEKENNKPRLFYESLGGADAWDTEHYLNIWVAPTCEAFLGTAAFPNSTLPEEDGLVIDSKYFGVRLENSTSFPYHLGKTTTHEVGHYFNLKHIWGEPGCTVDDLVADTPPQENAYRGCPIHPNSSCGSTDMFMNFMNYVDDECLLFFTEGQKQRMLATLLGPRSGLMENDFCGPKANLPVAAFHFFPNPARDCINVLLEGDATLDYPWILFDAVGKTIDSGTNSYGKIHPINVQGLTSGIYFLKVNQGKEFFTQKILILPGSF